MEIHEIGGYFELDLKIEPEVLNKDAVYLESARACLKLVLKARKPVAVWLPYYTCGVLIKAVEEVGLKIRFYHIDKALSIEENLFLGTDEVLVYTNYFGICDNATKRMLERFGGENVIVDCSQSFYVSPYKCLATFYSPRKFMGLPDGGIVYTNLDLKPNEQSEYESINRLSHLYIRKNVDAKTGYSQFLEADASLNHSSSRAMSEITKTLLSHSISRYSNIQRLENFKRLHDYFSKINNLRIQSDVSSPLCYPLLLKKDVAKIREALVNENIFTPKYWPDLKLGLDSNSFENKLANFMVCLPIDHRYTLSDMDYIIKKVGKLL